MFDDQVTDAPTLSRSVVEERLARHREFVAETRENGDTLGYESERYDFPVRTRQERDLRFYAVDSVARTGDGYRAVHEPF